MSRRSAEKLSNVPFNRQSIKSIYFALLIGMSLCPFVLWTYVRLLATLNNIFLEKESEGKICLFELNGFSKILVTSTILNAKIVFWFPLE